MVTENPTMAMAMASTYTRWKRLVSGLAGGSSLKGQADFNPNVVTTREKHATREVHFRRASSANEGINAWILVCSGLAKRSALLDTPKKRLFLGPTPRVPAFYLNGLSADIRCHLEKE